MSDCLVPFDGALPQCAPEVFLAPGCKLIGRVSLGKQSSVWFNAVVRADINTIQIGERSNVQDNAVLHVNSGEGVLVIGDDVTIGHGAILHACTIGNGVLIGMGAIVLDGARVGDGSVIAAGALVTPGSIIPAGSLCMGSPAKVVRNLVPADIAKNLESAARYLAYACNMAAALQNK